MVYGFLFVLLIIGCTGIFIAELLAPILMWRVVHRRLLPGGIKRWILVYLAIGTGSVALCGICVHLINEAFDTWVIPLAILCFSIIALTTAFLTFRAKRHEMWQPSAD